MELYDIINFGWNLVYVKMMKKPLILHLHRLNIYQFPLTKLCQQQNDIALYNLFCWSFNFLIVLISLYNFVLKIV